jgi:hypothetical protein
MRGGRPWQKRLACRDRGLGASGLDLVTGPSGRHHRDEIQSVRVTSGFEFRNNGTYALTVLR